MPQDKWEQRRRQAASDPVRKQRSSVNLDRIESRIEEQIRKAQEAGAFENLPGYGKPLPKDPGYDLDSGNWMSNRVLRQSGHVPAWVELRKEITAERDEVRTALATYREQAQVLDRSIPADADELQHLEDRYVALARDINKKIDQHNSHCPPSQTLTRFVDDATRRWE